MTDITVEGPRVESRTCPGLPDHFSARVYCALRSFLRLGSTYAFHERTIHPVNNSPTGHYYLAYVHRGSYTCKLYSSLESTRRSDRPGPARPALFPTYFSQTINNSSTLARRGIATGNTVAHESTKRMRTKDKDLAEHNADDTILGSKTKEKL